MLLGKIQIIGLRYYKNKNGSGKDYLKVADCYYEREWRYDSVKQLFENLDKFYEKLDVPRENLFFTVANSGPGKRQFQYLSVLALDIDGVSKDDLRDKILDYQALVAKVLKLEPSQVGLVSSGHGIHLYIGLAVPIVGAEALKEFKPTYNLLCQTLNDCLRIHSLSGEFDRRIIDGARILRLPGSINAKPDKAPVECKLINVGMEPVVIDFVEILGVPVVEKGEALATIGRLAIDDKAIWEGCAFMTSCKNSAPTLAEPLWYAALSITSRMTEPSEASRLVSEGHPGFSIAGMESKMEQAREASGPLTCEKINQLWGKCSNCANYKKVVSPILLKSKNFIATEGTGFHTIEFSASGMPKLGKPAIEDLRMFFEQKYIYVAQAKTCFKFNGKFWEEVDDDFILSFAHKHFFPKPLSIFFEEFKKALLRTNIVTGKFWDTTKRKINFANGVYDLDKRELVPHSPEFGFKYCLDYDYDPIAPAPEFENFLEQVCCGDVDIAKLLLEFFGYALSGDACHFDKFLIMHGEGSNGKSTLLDVFREVLGRQAYSSIMMQKLASEGSLAYLDGKLVNIAEEINTNKQDTDVLKALVSGAPTSARKLYKDQYEYTNRAKLIFACNELPKTFDTTDGFFRRAIVIPFCAVFSSERGNKDPFILKKLLAELPGVVNLILSGYYRLMEQGGFTSAAASEMALREYRIDMDTVRQWSEECLIISSPDSETKSDTDDLFQNYENWRISAGVSYQIPKRSFLRSHLKRLLKDYEMRFESFSKNSVRKSFLRGISMRSGNF